MKTSEQTNEIFEALSKAQSEIKTIKKSKTVKVTMKSGGSYTYDYAPLSDILEAINKPLTKNGLSLIQSTVHREGLLGVETILGHSSGQWIKSEGCFFSTNGMRIQDFGGVITYLRRYDLSAFISISSEDDSDGNPQMQHEHNINDNKSKGGKAAPKSSGTGKGKSTDQKEKPKCKHDDPELAKKLRAGLLEIEQGDMDNATALLKRFTTFTMKDKKTGKEKEVPGVTHINMLTTKRLQVTWNKLRREYPELDKDPEPDPPHDELEKAEDQAAGDAPRSNGDSYRKRKLNALAASDYSKLFDDLSEDLKVAVAATVDADIKEEREKDEAESAQNAEDLGI